MEETIISIFEQDYSNLELLVVDGGSTDNSTDIIRKYENQIDWWVSEKDRGQSDAINKGIKKATGEIINWINSDDLLVPGALHTVADHFLKASDDIGLVHGGTTIFRGNAVIRNDWGYTEPCLERYLSGMAFSQPSAFIKKEYLNRVGGYVNEDLHYGMDYDLYGRLACVCRFLPVEEIFAKYRLHDSSKTIMDRDKFILDWNKVFITLCNTLGWDDVLSGLNDSGIIDPSLLESKTKFDLQPDRTLLVNADKKKILFYHFCYILKSIYKSGEFSKAKRLRKLLVNDYPADWLDKEKEIPPIIKRLLLPGPLISFLRKIRNTG